MHRLCMLHTGPTGSATPFVYLSGVFTHAGGCVQATVDLSYSRSGLPRLCSATALIRNTYLEDLEPNLHLKGTPFHPSNVLIKNTFVEVPEPW